MGHHSAGLGTVLWRPHTMSKVEKHYHMANYVVVYIKGCVTLQEG